MTRPTFTPAGEQQEAVPEWVKEVLKEFDTLHLDGKYFHKTPKQVRDWLHTALLTADARVLAAHAHGEEVGEARGRKATLKEVGIKIKRRLRTSNVALDTVYIKDGQTGGTIPVPRGNSAEDSWYNLALIELEDDLK